MSKFICDKCRNVYTKKKKICICGGTEFSKVDRGIAEIVSKMMKLGCDVIVNNSSALQISHGYKIMATYSPKSMRLFDSLYTCLASDILIGVNIDVTITRESLAKLKSLSGDDIDGGIRYPETIQIRVVGANDVNRDVILDKTSMFLDRYTSIYSH